MSDRNRLPGSGVTRRQFGVVAGASLISWIGATACELGRTLTNAEQGRLSLPTPVRLSDPVLKGTSRLGLTEGRDAILKLPDPLPAKPMAMMVLFHGATGSAEKFLGRLSAATVPADLAVLAIDSRGVTWDAIRGGFGPDVAFTQQALSHVLRHVPIDRDRLSLGGFSDGATYALSLGLINGDVFKKVVAFSAGFVVDGPMHGHASFFVSHGTHDSILPIDDCGRRIVKALKLRNYDVTFREFDGDHEVPPAIATEAFRWAATR